MTEHTIISPQSPTTAPAAVKDVMPIQEQLQNETDSQTFQKLTIQCKLSIGSSDGPLEHEADTIMQMPENKLIQRKCTSCEEEDKVQRKPWASFIQKKGVQGGMLASDSVSNRINSSRGMGSGLSGSTKSFMESRFGTDFSNVNIHTGSEATNMSRDLGAKAFTVGNNIYFNKGQYAPESFLGKRLLAHELTHVVQQKGIVNSIQKSPGGVGLHGTQGIHEELTQQYAQETGIPYDPGLRFTQSFRQWMTSSLPVSTPLPADQHAGAGLPDTTRSGQIHTELNPSSSSGGASLPWDGGTSSPLPIRERTRKRTELRREVRRALIAHMRNVMPDIRRRRRLRRLPMTSFEGAGRAAKSVTDAKFGQYTSAAALTPSQASHQSSFQFRASSPNQTLFNAYSRRQRRLAGSPIDVWDLANWIAETDTTSQAAMSRHNFNPNRSNAEENYLLNRILPRFVNLFRSQLKLYDRFGFAISGQRVVVGSSINPNFSDTRSVTQPHIPSDAERAAQWGVWKILVHEYIHKLTHPQFQRATGRGNRIMTEGFTELFTKEVLQAEIPGAPANTTLRQEVEGGSYPPPAANMVGTYSAGSYAGYLSHVENIMQNLGGTGAGVGRNALKGAFFQGHVEFLGLNPSGTQRVPAAANSSDLITVPNGITSWSLLASVTRVSEAIVLAANPGFTSASPLPAILHVPGTREHIVVEARNRRAVSGTVETLAQIAAQNGMTASILRTANPLVNWSALTVGQKILIPKR